VVLIIRVSDSAIRRSLKHAVLKKTVDRFICVEYPLNIRLWQVINTVTDAMSHTQESLIMSEATHILSKFDDDLRILNAKVMEFEELLNKNLLVTEKSLSEWSCVELSEAIVSAGDYRRKAVEVGYFARQVLLRFSPVAYDLRFVLARIRVCTNLDALCGELEEIARRLKSIIENCGDFDTGDKRENVQKIGPLFEMARHEFCDAMQALANDNRELAASVRRRDSDLDTLHRQLMDDLAMVAREPSHSMSDDAQWLVHGVFLIRALERVGDHAKNIADEVIFVTSARIASHTPEPDA